MELKQQRKSTSSGVNFYSLIFFLLINSLVFSAQNAFSDSIEVHDPWIRAPAPFAHALAGFMLIKNTTDTPLSLVQVKADGFGEVMLHQSINENGMHRMEHVANIIIPAQGEMRFQHGSYHIMFMGLHKKALPGNKIPVTLIFDNGLQKHVLYIIKKPD